MGTNFRSLILHLPNDLTRRVFETKPDRDIWECSVFMIVDQAGQGFPVLAEGIANKFQWRGWYLRSRRPRRRNLGHDPVAPYDCPEQTGPINDQEDTDDNFSHNQAQRAVEDIEENPFLLAEGSPATRAKDGHAADLSMTIGAWMDQIGPDLRKRGLHLTRPSPQHKYALLPPTAAKALHIITAPINITKGQGAPEKAQLLIQKENFRNIVAKDRIGI